MCECYKIGGPFIAEDPNCPVHGYQAQRDERERKEKESSLLERIENLENLVIELQEQLDQR